MAGKLTMVIVGVLLIVGGAFVTFKPSLDVQKEGANDLWAILGIVLMILGVILAASPLFK